MLLAKVYVSKQYSLSRQLHEYYSKGLGCLLQSPPVRSYTIIILSNPKVYICTDQDVITSEVLNNVILFYEMHKFTDFGTVNVFLRYSVVAIMTAEQLVDLLLTACQKVMLEKLTATILEHIAFRLHNKCSSPRVNKQMYTVDKLSCSVLEIAVRFGCISDFLFTAMYHYKT